MVSLENSKIFGQLKPAELAELRGMAQERTFGVGQEIFKEGDAGDGVYVVKDGVVEISVAVGNRGRQVFSKSEPGDMFGEMAVIEDKPRSASAVAQKGATVYFIARADMLKLVDSSPELARALLREISHRLREFNRQYLREVLQAERLGVVGRFARSIVHDLKNPLNIIGLSAEIAATSHGTAELRQRAILDIRQQVDRISDLIGEILDFTQGASPDLVLPPMDYARFVEQVVEELRPEIAVKSATLELENPAPPVALLLNPKRLRRVFHNLVHNATEAMPSGGRIILRFQLRPTELVTEIEDTGPGIAPEIAGQLFEPFATYGKANGTGLGLSISKRIIEDHKGWMAARSEPGHGAIFQFALPAAGRAQDVEALKR
ncbi:MAG TPA: ATP-binding protein [Candidatus Acidoferrum sp.]|jgi:signal transduction histidine kinase|nr:ATP-binding protein [Candidatus Acidoferrum sp.]